MTFEVTYEWFESQMKQIMESLNWMDKLYDTDVFAEEVLDMFGRKIEQPVHMLQHILHDEKSWWISYWLYDLDCGKRWEPGMVEDKDGKEIKLQTLEDLWKVLTEKE